MAVNYSICMLKNPQKPEEPRKAYAKTQVSQVMSLKMLGRKVSAESTCSRADVEAVLVCTVEKMLEALREGYQVVLGDLGKFRLQITSRGTLKVEDFSAERIESARVCFSPGEDLKNIFAGLEFNNVPSRAAVRELLKKQKQEADEKPIV